MKPFVTMGLAVFLCGALFFLLNPLAEDSLLNETASPSEETASGLAAETKEEPAVDKIAEFPVFPEQREKLKALQQSRLESTKGMEPVSIDIPSIDVKAAIEPTGVLENGEMGVPENVDQVGWFEPGYKPGAKGHSVFAGHVDSLTGPAIFYDLKKVKAGEKVALTDADGRKMVFSITAIKSYETDEAPIEKIFGKSDARMINLITCTGDFNRSIGSHEERLVVTAELISDSATAEKLPAPPSQVTATSSSLSWHAVRDDAIIGYRVYEENPETGEIKKIETVSLFDRKKVAIQNTDGKRYFITSVDVDLNESEKAEAVQ